MKRFIVPALPDETSEEEDVYELTHIDHLFIRDRIEIPGFSNYETLKCDFHTHTVFSDGLVWPDARIYEAWQEGLDAIAITDHIEHRINKVILKGDLNESYKIAKKAADDMDFIVIPGAEITRSKPLGKFRLSRIQRKRQKRITERSLPCSYKMSILWRKKILWNLLPRQKGKGHLLCGIIPAGRIIRPLYIPYMKN